MVRIMLTCTGNGRTSNQKLWADSRLNKKAHTHTAIAHYATTALGIVAKHNLQQVGSSTEIRTSTPSAESNSYPVKSLGQEEMTPKLSSKLFVPSDSPDMGAIQGEMGGSHFRKPDVAPADRRPKHPKLEGNEFAGFMVKASQCHCFFLQNQSIMNRIVCS